MIYNICDVVSKCIVCSPSLAQKVQSLSEVNLGLAEAHLVSKLAKSGLIPSPSKSYKTPQDQF